MLLFIIEPITKHAIWYLIFCSCFFFFKNLQRETTENARKLYKNTSLCHFHRSIFLTFLATLNKSQFFRYFKVKRIFNQKWKQKPSFNHKKRAKVCVKTKLCTWERKTLQPLSPLDGVPWLKHKVPLPISGIQSCVLHGSFSSGLSCGSQWVLVVMSSDRHRTSRTLNPPSQDLEHCNRKQCSGRLYGILLIQRQKREPERHIHCSLLSTSPLL